LNARDLGALAISALYLLLVLGGAEFARRRGMSRVDTRRIVHVAVGTWILPTFLLYETAFWAAAPAFAFVVVNALSQRFELIRSVELKERSLGTVLFPLSIGLLTLWGWQAPWRPVAVAGVLSMAWGDAAASFVGRRWGRRIYRVSGHPRSLEGSLSMLLVTWLAILVSFAVLSAIPTDGLVRAAFAAALAATLLEAFSLWGVDNLLVPLGVAGVLALLRGRWWA
jgi:phytol kinase